MRRKASLFSLLFILLAAGAQLTCATGFIQTNAFITAEGEITADDLLIAANYIEIKGLAQNDLFLISSSQSWKELNEKEGAILLAGKCANDVWAVANKIDVSGNIQDHARLLAKLITVSGIVSNSAIFIANTIHITQTACLGKDVRLIGENVLVEGRVDGNLNIFGKNITLSGECSGNVQLTAADIAVLPKTRIGGNLVYRSPRELVLDKNVVLQGRLMRAVEGVAKEERKPFISWPSLAMQSWLFIGALAAGVLLLLIFPALVENSVREINNSAWKCMLVGSMAACLIPLACLFLALSIIGLPLAMLAAAFFAVLAYISKLMVGVVIGNLITRRNFTGLKAFPAMGLGLVFLYLAAGAGILGNIIWFLIVCLGLGGMISGYLAKRSLPSA
jgi:cytoskeletal protein CcmA (bactofilin family)